MFGISHKTIEAINAKTEHLAEHGFHIDFENRAAIVHFLTTVRDVLKNPASDKVGAPYTYKELNNEGRHSLHYNDEHLGDFESLDAAREHRMAHKPDNDRLHFQVEQEVMDLIGEIGDEVKKRIMQKNSFDMSGTDFERILDAAIEDSGADKLVEGNTSKSEAKTPARRVSANFGMGKHRNAHGQFTS